MQNIEKIYEQYAQMLYKYIFCLTGSKDITEDIVQETFEIAIKKINEFKGECKLSTWLCQIAKYIWYNKLRKDKKDVSLEEIKNIISQNQMEEFEQKQEKIELFKKIQSLDEETRNVIYLRTLGDLTYKEIAEIMGKTENWARVVFFRGKQKLKNTE